MLGSSKYARQRANDHCSPRTWSRNQQKRFLDCLPPGKFRKLKSGHCLLFFVVRHWKGRERNNAVFEAPFVRRVRVVGEAVLDMTGRGRIEAAFPGCQQRVHHQRRQWGCGWQRRGGGIALTRGMETAIRAKANAAHGKTME